ncbi:Uncharacterized protein T310_5712 [Rasamsonia emersonii CBS 393.64]|uniref:Transcription factor IIIC 90kDa subunit N-terminal domain-containing protein n=1 Tax=Rasamsonia emersonii (strain ATCC 16479 / CBS 393.64 / IMI 116815) TaxID=1408163 RepID=A0A0F4YPS8_RASE3|nr:Uncharacterized protein T310_5712 [Rasamsonia emersonii CBS 393.64]KKA20249.1 Uncharacterized protein T310_5712 [Rasamsonia emersonii CBS 393.64]
MAEPVELQLFPSCYSCLAWSADGELAVAAGENVHFLTPNITSRSAGTAQSTGKPSPWLFTRVRVNMFTNKEWEMTWPQTRDHFSVGAEQSISTVAALSWSPPGLAKHRRCLLGVLTSNLVLSFYEPVGPQGKWTRVAIASNALAQYFSSQSIADPGLKLRKKRIRSFAWCPPLKDPALTEGAGASDDAILSLEQRWGRYLLAVTNDDNDFIILEIKRRQGKSASGSPYTIEALSHISIHDPVGKFPMIAGGSLFAKEMKSRARVCHISCGPWIRQSSYGDKDALSSRAIVGAIYGSKLKLIDLDARSVSGDRVEVRIADRAEFSVPGCKLEDVNFTGPLQWVFDEQSSSIVLAAGIFVGRAILTLSEEVYTGKDTQNKGVAFSQRLFSDDRGDGADSVSQKDHSRYWEPISSITVVNDKNGKPDTLHLSTVGAWAEASPCSTLQEGQILHPEWKKQVEDFRERFDIDRDLGGLAVARTWGLATYRGWIVAAFTMHPGDMVEYTTAAEERTTLVFSAAAPDISATDGPLPEMPNLTEEHFRKQREGILRFILSHAASEEKGLRNISIDLRSAKLVYAAAACSIVEHRNEELLSLARQALERLSTSCGGTDLSDEISKCSPTAFVDSAPTIASKSADVLLNGPGGRIFEKCEICGSGIEWYSVPEAQCTAGHLFVFAWLEGS